MGRAHGASATQSDSVFWQVGHVMRGGGPRAVPVVFQGPIRIPHMGVSGASILGALSEGDAMIESRLYSRRICRRSRHGWALQG